MRKNNGKSVKYFFKSIIITIFFMKVEVLMESESYMPVPKWVEIQVVGGRKCRLFDYCISSFKRVGGSLRRGHCRKEELKKQTGGSRVHL